MKPAMKMNPAIRQPLDSQGPSLQQMDSCLRRNDGGGELLSHNHFVTPAQAGVHPSFAACRETPHSCARIQKIFANSATLLAS